MTTLAPPAGTHFAPHSGRGARLLLAAVVVCLGASVLFSHERPAPSYRRQPLVYWTEAFLDTGLRAGNDRSQSYAAIEAMGSPAVAALAARFASEPLPLRHRILTLAKALPVRACAPLIPVFQIALQDPDPSLRRHAAEVLARIQP